MTLYVSKQFIIHIFNIFTSIKGYKAITHIFIISPLKIIPSVKTAIIQPKKRRARTRGGSRVPLVQPGIYIKQKVQFFYPKTRQVFESVNNRYHLRDLLSEQSRQDKVDIQMQTYSYQRKNRGYIYTRCLNCDSIKLKYLKVNTSDTNTGYKLTYFENSHVHSRRLRRKKYLYNMNEVFQIMRNTPKNMPVCDFRQYIKDRYGKVNDNHVYYMLNRFKQYHQNLQTVTEHLKTFGADIWTQIFKIDQPLSYASQVEIQTMEDPEFFMFALPKMIEYFRKYGDCCYFSIKKGLIKKKGPFSDRQWNIVAFNGLTCHNKFAPFALAFLEQTPKSFQNMVQLIKRVFNWGKIPKVLITPSQDIYIDILTHLKRRNIFNGLHLFDALEELQQIQKVVADANIYKYFQDIVYSINREEYFQNVQKFHRNVVPTFQIRKLFNSLQEKAYKMCFALINTDNFIGLAYRYSANRYMSYMARYLYTHNSQSSKLNIPKPRQLYPTIKALVKEYNKLLQPELPYIGYQLWRLEWSMNNPEIQLVRNRLKASVMEMFLAQFHKSFTLDVRQRTLSQEVCSEIKIFDIFDRGLKAVFVVAPRPEYDSRGTFKKLIWRCSCLFSIKSGMPCQHQIKVVMLKKDSLLDQVHQRWIQAKIGKKKAPGRPKSSRTNKLK